MRGRLFATIELMNTAKFQKMLEDELHKLEGELKGIGRKNPDDPNDWVAVPETDGEIATDPDRNVQADAKEDFEERSAVEGVLENRLNEVKDALARIESGKYGICEVGGEEIEEDRLEANPAATTCKLHME